METYVLMIFSYFSPTGSPDMRFEFHSVYGFPTEHACEHAYDSLSPSAYGLRVNHTCEQVVLSEKLPDPLFVVPLTPKPDKKAHK